MLTQFGLGGDYYIVKGASRSFAQFCCAVGRHTTLGQDGAGVDVMNPVNRAKGKVKRLPVNWVIQLNFGALPCWSTAAGA